MNENEQVNEQMNEQMNAIRIELTCKSCNEDLQLNENVCYNCGLETGAVEYSNYSFEENEIIIKKTPYNHANSRILKIQEWLNWSSEEKNEYKLNVYTKNFCYNLNNHYKNSKEQILLTENIIEQSVAFVSKVMKAIKDDFNGPKRAKVKDGLVIMCVYYILKFNEIYSSYIVISKILKIEIKYISKANKTITELINKNKLKVSDTFKDTIFKTQKPIDYINKVIQKYKLTINKEMLNQVSDLINICEDNDILLDHTPLSVGVSCFYYILEINSIEIDLKIFSDIYSISIITILKTFNKLTNYKVQFEKMGINTLKN